MRHPVPESDSNPQEVLFSATGLVVEGPTSPRHQSNTFAAVQGELLRDPGRERPG